MKLNLSILPVMALALTACDGGTDEPKSIDDVVEEASNMVQPKPGQYRSTTELVSIDIPGAPAALADRMKDMLGGQFSQTVTSCLTQADAANGFEQQFRELGEGMNGLKCDFERFDVDGGDVDAVLACSGEGSTKAKLTMDGEMQDERQNIAMSMAMDNPQIPGGKMTVAMNVLNERTGDCP